MASAEGLVFAEGKDYAAIDPWLTPTGRRVGGLWASVVEKGSAIAVVFAKRI